jgi:peptide/nickel transport system permease protein
MNGVHRFAVMLKRIGSTLPGAVGLLIISVVVFAAIFAPLIVTHDPDRLDLTQRFALPSWQHWLGADNLGRDLYSRLVYGASVAMAVALSSISFALVVGTCLGIAAAYLPTRSERVILIIFDIIYSFPSVVLALAVIAVFGPSTALVICVVAVTLLPQFGRVARAQVLTIKSAPFLEAERLIGASGMRIVLAHVLPNIMGPLIVLAGMNIPVVITIEAGLSFIGLGVRPPLASWGTLINDGYAYLSDSATPVIVSSVALAIATLGFTLFGEALRDAIDPRMRRVP